MMIDNFEGSKAYLDKNYVIDIRLRINLFLRALSYATDDVLDVYFKM